MNKYWRWKVKGRRKRSLFFEIGLFQASSTDKKNEAFVRDSRRIPDDDSCPAGVRRGTVFPRSRRFAHWSRWQTFNKFNVWWKGTGLSFFFWFLAVTLMIKLLSVFKLPLNIIKIWNLLKPEKRDHHHIVLYQTQMAKDHALSVTRGESGMHRIVQHGIHIAFKT